MKILKPRHNFAPYSMICGPYEAEKRRYKKYIGKSGRIFLVAIQEDSASNIYVFHPLDHNSEGFGGRTLEFKLENDSIVKAKGPWHTNPDDLYNETGVDIRDKHFTRTVVGLGRDLGGITDVIYCESKPILGEFNRGNKITQGLADKLDTVVYYYIITSGGSSNGPVKPTNWSAERYKEYWDLVKLSKLH